MFLGGHFPEKMEGIVDTNPVPAVEEPEIPSDVSTGPRPAEPTASGGSGGGDGSATSRAWSLTEEEQVHNLKENWKRAFTWADASGNEFETNPWFAKVVAKVRTDPCLDSFYELEIDKSLEGGLVLGFRMTSLDVAILMGDLKMVQYIVKRSSDPAKLVRGSPVDGKLASSRFLDAISPKETGFLYTPLHLAVVVGNSDIVDMLVKQGSDVNAQNLLAQTPLHYLAAKHPTSDDIKILNSLAQDKTLNVRASDYRHYSPFYVSVLSCNTQMVIALLETFKEQIQVNEKCDKVLGRPIQIAYEGGNNFKDILIALMECEPIKSHMERLYTDRQVYVDAANAILVGAALIAGVTFASWLQPPLNYTSYSGEGYSSSVLAPSTSDFNYADVEHNIALRAFWVFNALSFYFATATVVCGARSVLPKRHLYIKEIVKKLRRNLLVTSILLACLVLCVIVAFAIARTIVLTPLLKYQWCMIVPTIVGGIVCIVSLGSLVKSMIELSHNTRKKHEKFYMVIEQWRKGKSFIDISLKNSKH